MCLDVARWLRLDSCDSVAVAVLVSCFDSCVLDGYEITECMDGLVNRWID